MSKFSHWRLTIIVIQSPAIWFTKAPMDGIIHSWLRPWVWILCYIRLTWERRDTVILSRLQSYPISGYLVIFRTGFRSVFFTRRDKLPKERQIFVPFFQYSWAFAASGFFLLEWKHRVGMDDELNNCICMSILWFWTFGIWIEVNWKVVGGNARENLAS